MLSHSCADEPRRGVAVFVDGVSQWRASLVCVSGNPTALRLTHCLLCLAHIFIWQNKKRANQFSFHALSMSQTDAISVFLFHVCVPASIAIYFYLIYKALVLPSAAYIKPY